MSPDLTTVLAAAQSLPVAERRELIDLLLEGLDDSPQAEAEGQAPVLSEAWRQEVTRRSAEYDAGRAETVAWQEVQQRWQSRRASGG
jgi:putative addiction module component (TIGR02574 family)